MLSKYPSIWKGDLRGEKSKSERSECNDNRGEERGGGSNKAHDVSTIRLYPEAI